MINENFDRKVEQLTEQIKIQNSIQRNFFVGVVRGFGSALGATVVFGLVLALVFQFVRTIDYVPILNTILSSEAIEEIIRRFTQPQ